MERRSRAQGGVTGRPKPRLYLFTPRLDDTAPFAAALAPALSAGDIAAVLLRLNDADRSTLIHRVKAIAQIVQHRDIALLIDGRPELVAPTGADGAHLAGVDALRAAIATLKPNHIAGAGGLRSRHDAMLAGEAGADYVMFGEPAWAAAQTGTAASGDGRRIAFAAAEERVAWWAQLFEVPCIGYAEAADEIRPLVLAGADFVALGEWIWVQPERAEAAVARAQKVITACG
jgi:thiamine-phosphate pyrophosphorylase